jgi:hypothetical protein
MLSDLTEKQRDLANYMSFLSEMAWHSGWQEGLEFDLWSAVVNGRLQYGQLMLEPHHINELKRLSDACGGWIYFDEKLEESFMSKKNWLAKLAEQK